MEEQKEEETTTDICASVRGGDTAGDSGDTADEAMEADECMELVARK